MGKWNLQRRRSHSELPRLQELERAVQAEIQDILGREELFLRSTSELTELMKKLGRTQGRAYFRYVLREVFGEKSRLYETNGVPSSSQVCVYAKSIIQRLAKAIHFAPLVLRAGCHYMLTEFRKAFPDCKHNSRIVVGSLLFLRILCPALIKPEMFDFPAHTAQSLPMGVQIAKLLQHTLSGTPVGENDAGCNDSNAFIHTFQPFVFNFLVQFPQIRDAFGLEELQLPEVRSAASWDCSAVAPITPTTPTTPNWPPSPRPQSWDAHPGKMRGLSMISSDAMKSKRKFSLRFWSRGSGLGQRHTPVCAVEEQLKDSDRVMVMCGSSSGELVVLRNELETQRFQLEGAVQQICYYGDGEFVVGDLLGNLYGVTQYEILWKVEMATQLPMVAPQDGFATECFYPGVAQPVVKAITHAKLLDVEKTLSNYVIVATGQKHLLVTHRGKNFGMIPTRTPIGTLASFSIAGAKATDEDIVLAAGEEGMIYRLVSYRDVAPKEMPDFRFAMERWTQLSFPIAKLLSVKTPESPTDAKSDDFAWICLGVDGEVVLFRGQERVKQWDFATSEYASSP
ncbi:hypothetical protein BBJ29_000257 [Phytophthora kernoviae]|uniref:Ras-GAP domain-containing protein n=1 Tax=Phytophthora kernoviae TaxID=325452 RepID=A0A3F2RDG4_9STRA|nr:hypothetical protein BBP00_00009578 [Phytophthora kernoviae]RLN70702.1 hypothetical protein BBJ29_000257 [Phytophthora kernoviae]